MVAAEVPLPCEERIYQQEGLARPPSGHHRPVRRARLLPTKDIDFSSYSYRIEAVRILGRVVAWATWCRANKSRWRSSMPHCQLVPPPARIQGGTAAGPTALIDEMMFQATMIVNGAPSIAFRAPDLLSRPPSPPEVICGTRPVHVCPPLPHAHAMKAVKAATNFFDPGRSACR